MLLGKDGDGDEKICINPKCECRRKKKKDTDPFSRKNVAGRAISTALLTSPYSASSVRSPLVAIV
jgi:hypothetical protein